MRAASVVTSSVYSAVGKMWVSTPWRRRRGYPVWQTGSSMSGRRVTLSMGISCYPEDASSYEELYQKADQALYRVKRSGKNAFSVYDKNYNYVDYTSDTERKQTGRPASGRSWRNIIKDVSGQKQKVRFCLL